MARQRAAAAAPAADEVDILDRILNTAADAPEDDTKKKRSDRPTINLTDEAEANLFGVFLAAQHTADQAEGQATAAKEEAVVLCRRLALDFFVDNGYLPLSYVVVSPHGTANFIVVNKLRFDALKQKKAEGGLPTLDEVLIGAGFKDEMLEEMKGLFETKRTLVFKVNALRASENADDKKLYKKVMDTIANSLEADEQRLLWGRDFADLIDGSNEDKAVIRKLLTAVSTAVPAAQHAKLWNRSVVITPRTDFLERVSSIVETREQMEAVLALVRPQYVLKDTVFGQAVAGPAAPVSPPAAPVAGEGGVKTFKSGDEKWLVEITGKKVQLFAMPGKKLTAEKECSNPGHAVNTGRLWANDDARRTEAVEKHKVAA